MILYEAKNVYNNTLFIGLPIFAIVVAQYANINTTEFVLRTIYFRPFQHFS